MAKSTGMALTGIATLLVLVLGGTAGAAEMKVLSAVAMKPALDGIIRDFERTSGHRVTVAYATAGVVRNRIRDGEVADVVIAPGSAFNALASEGRIARDTAAGVAQSLLAVAVRKGAPKPDISSPEALKRTLLAATSIVTSDPTKGGATGIHAARVFERLGITEAIKSKTTLTPGGEYAEVLSRGEAELALVQPMVLVGVPGVEIVGPVPAELQDKTDLVFTAGVAAKAKEPAAAQAFIKYLLGPEATRAIKAKGMEPVGK